MGDATSPATWRGASQVPRAPPRSCCSPPPHWLPSHVWCTADGAPASLRRSSCGSAATTSPTPTACRRPSRRSSARSRRAGTSGSGAARTTSRSRRTGCPTARSASRSPPARPLVAAIAGPLEDLYPDVRLIEQAGRPRWAACVVRLKKRHSYVLSLQTVRNYEHAFSESLVALLGGLDANTTVQLVLTPAPGVRPRPRPAAAQAPRARPPVRRPPRRGRARRRLASSSTRSSRGRSRPSTARSATSSCASPARTPTAVRRVAGTFSQLRSENELVQTRDAPAPPALRPPARAGAAQPAARPRARHPLDLRAGHALAAAARAQQARPHPAVPLRRAVAPPEICRDPERRLLVDEHGPVGLAPGRPQVRPGADGRPGGGKSSRDGAAAGRSTPATTSARSSSSTRKEDARRGGARDDPGRPHRPLPRPRPPRDRVQPAPDRRQPGHPRQRVPRRR